MYESDDPRSALATATPTASNSAFGQSSYARPYQEPPQEVTGKAKTWYTRGQNMIICYSDVEDGAVFERTAENQTDEWVLLLHDRNVGATVEANGETVEVEGYSIVMVPPGASKVTARGNGYLVRLISTQAADLVAKVSNPGAYSGEHPHCPPFEPWPDPVGGFRIRAYSLDVPEQQGRFGKLFRCTTFMVNAFEIAPPRSLDKLSPHHHDDFEQCSLSLAGSYTHHLRWPWTANYYDWQEDEHEVCGTPGICIIPPRVVHTSAPSDPEGNVLMDIFAPPRQDFSNMKGWVLNADEYPQKPE